MIANALHKVNKTLDQHSIRRGALQTMAAAGIPLEDIKLFSKHADLNMLRRYLRFGKVPTEEGGRGMKASRHLL
jgi:hypothetical protein